MHAMAAIEIARIDQRRPLWNSGLLRIGIQPQFSQ